jgi:hypothetical protein
MVESARIEELHETAASSKNNGWWVLKIITFTSEVSNNSKDELVKQTDTKDYKLMSDVVLQLKDPIKLADTYNYQRKPV